MNLTLLVVTYNSSLYSSQTLKSLMTQNLENINLSVVIWNNGPAFFDDEDISNYIKDCKSLGVSIKIFQDLRNLSLSVIYNKFSSEDDYEFISIFDQDSIIPFDFFQNILKHHENYLILPIINTSHDKIESRYPCFISGPNKKSVINEGLVTEKITSITSGISISKKLYEEFISFRGFLFNESLGFYGIDVEFFIILNKIIDVNHKVNIYCVGSITHSLSCDDENERKSSFRMVELFYFQMYYRRKKQMKGELSNLWIYLREIMRGKIKVKYILPTALFMYENKHPRSKMKISENIKPTNQYP